VAEHIAGFPLEFCGNEAPGASLSALAAVVRRGTSFFGSFLGSGAAAPELTDKQRHD